MFWCGEGQFKDFDTSLKTLTSSFSSSDFEVKDSYKNIEYSTETRNKKIGGGILGTIASIGTGIALASNPVGWAIAGTIAAGLVGSYIGGEIGEASGSKQTESIKVGDNKEEIIQKFKSNRLEHYEKFAKDLYQQMENTFFNPLQSTSQQISYDVEQFSKKINKIL